MEKQVRRDRFEFHTNMTVLNHENGSLSIGRESIGNSQTGCTRTSNDVVIFLLDVIRPSQDVCRAEFLWEGGNSCCKSRSEGRPSQV